MEEQSKNHSCKEASIELLRKYQDKLAELGIESRPRGTRLQHTKWMCATAQGYDDICKMSRWLGWIQATMVVENIYGLDEIIDHTRKKMNQ